MKLKAIEIILKKMKRDAFIPNSLIMSHRIKRVCLMRCLRRGGSMVLHEVKQRTMVNRIEPCAVPLAHFPVDSTNDAGVGNNVDPDDATTSPAGQQRAVLVNCT